MNIKEVNELFKTLVGAGLVMPNEAGARWFGQQIALLGGIRHQSDNRLPIHRSSPNVLKDFK